MYKSGTVARRLAENLRFSLDAVSDAGDRRGLRASHEVGVVGGLRVRSYL